MGRRGRVLDNPVKKSAKAAAVQDSGAHTSAAAQPQAAPRRPRWVRVTAVLVLLVLAAALAWVRWPQGRAETAIARAADKATPQIAPLLREINDVACTLVERYPDSPEALDVLARLHYRFTESEAAIEYWHQAMELDPQFAPSYHSIGLYYLEVGEHARSAEYFRKALQIEPRSPAYAVELAQALIGGGQVDEGIDVLQRNLQAHPRAMATLAMLGHAYVQKREYELAKRYFEQAIEVGPDYTNAYHGLVTACSNLGEVELAKKYAEMLKEMKARDDATHRDMLQAFDDVGNVRGIMAEIYTAAANVYIGRNDPVMGEQFLLKALELAPKCIAAHEVLCWLYQRQGRKEDAARALRAFSTIAPDNLGARIGFADLAAEMGWFEEAEASYRQAIELTPQQGGGYAALARFYIEQVRNLPEARQLAQQAVDREPTATNYYWLGAACQINGDKAGALAAIRRAVELEPQHPEYRKVMRALGGDAAP